MTVNHDPNILILKLHIFFKRYILLFLLRVFL